METSAICETESLSIREAAELAGVGQSTLLDAIRKGTLSGEIESNRRGPGRPGYRVRRRDLEPWIRRQDMGPRWECPPHLAEVRVPKQWAARVTGRSIEAIAKAARRGTLPAQVWPGDDGEPALYMFRLKDLADWMQIPHPAKIDLPKAFDPEVVARIEALQETWAANAEVSGRPSGRRKAA